MEKIIGEPNAEYPILCPNTTQEDFDEMEYVKSLSSCTFREFMNYQMDDEEDALDVVTPLGQIAAIYGVSYA